MKTTGDEYFDSEEFQEILSNYEESVRSGTPLFMDADDLTDIADYYQYTGQRSQADETIDYALSLFPQATYPNIFKAREALERGNLQEAIDYAGRIEDKDHPEYQYIQAELLIAQDKIDEADQLLREYFADIPSEDYQNFVMDAANLYIDYGLSDKAYEWMMRTKGDESSDFKELMGRTLFGLGKYKDSERIFNELLDRNPFSKRYWNALANAQFMNEDFSSAVSSSEYAIAIDPDDAESLLSKANGLYRLENYEEAVNFYDRYLEKAPDDEFVLLHKGSCYVSMGQHEKAIEVLKKAIEAGQPDSALLPQIYQELAFCYSTLHRLDEALECINMTRQLDCDHIDMLVLRGHILLENGRLEEAEETFKNAIARSDSSPTIILRIIVSLYDNQYVRACYAMFKKFFSLIDDSFTDGYAYMALCCWDLGHTEEFLMYLRMAVDRNPKEARIVLGHLFPEDMPAKDYYQHMYQQLKSLRK